MKKAVFFDRDGVLNDNRVNVNKKQDLILYDGVKNALKKVYDFGFLLFVVTNQGGIERGYFTVKDLEEIHNYLKELTKDYCEFTEIMCCPYFDTKSEDRKPSPGMILKLAKKYDVDLKNSWMVGDREMDITAGIKAGCRTAKIGKTDKRADINESNLTKRDKNKKVDLESVIDTIIELDKEK